LRPFWLSSDVLSSASDSSLGLELLSLPLLLLLLESGEVLGSRFFLFFLGFFRLSSLSLLRLRRSRLPLLLAARFCRSRLRLRLRFRLRLSPSFPPLSLR
jgi:hypothetical protein